MSEPDGTLPRSQQPVPDLTDSGIKDMLAAALPDTPSRSNSRVWQPPTVEELQRLLPQYQILSVLGHGGMGAVYKGVQTSLHRSVAIKILPPEVAEDDAGGDYPERFKLEARAMAKLNHPGIVSVYDFGETTEGQLYIVMEYVDGTDVARMIKSQGRLPPDHALAITAHVCDALHYAHSHGVIHRDIKPANVLMSSEGQIKIADFGLAKAADPGASALTKTHLAVGTPDFIAPEALVSGLLVDLRADVYAVGVMLYNMLTGDIPRGLFQMPSQMVGSDPRYDAIIGHAMQADRDHRYADTMGMRRDVDEILSTPMATEGGDETSAPTLPAPAAEPQAKSETLTGPSILDAHPLAPKRFRVILWPVAGLATAVVAAVVLALWPPRKTAQPTAGSPALATKDVPFTNSLGMKFVPVPGTKVLFCIHDTRKGDYRQYVEAMPGVNDAWKDVRSEAGNLPVSEGEDHPVVMVSWEDAQHFCQWLSAREGRTYRLPTDAEWSWAVGIAEQEDAAALPRSKDCKIADVYPWGGDWPPPEGAGNYADQSLKEKLPWRPIFEGYRDGYPTTSPVMSFYANALGLFDMGGNVWQWCDDWDDADHKDRVLRGGCWAIYGPNGALSSARFHASPSYRRDAYGFRVVLVQ